MSALLLALLLQAAPSHPAPTPAPEVTQAQPPAEAAAAETAAHAPRAGEAETHGAFDPAAVIFHHVTDQPFLGIFASKHLVFLLLVAFVVIVVAQLAVRSYRGGRVPHGIGAAVESLVVFVRDEVAEPNIGHGDGRKFTPLLCSFFFFILVAALVGLIPKAATSTGNIAVTLALATVSFAAQQWAGISKYGIVGHFKSLVPPGMPMLLLPIMIPVEILGMFTKPFALTVRLFANMLAGHMVITTLLLLIPLMGQLHWLAGVAMTPISLLLAVFIMMLEVLVAFIQAYIFTLLSAIFIGMYAHPAH
ncbi:MAG TPA: F0F1 ATP synthase subunit A [Vicinamibacteria bacterium]|nr:F0F1 ATP synthase subunit A [Vicinamibacteria bacterium]